MRSVPTQGTVKPIEDMFAAMAASKDSSVRSRIHYIEEAVAAFEDRLNHRDIVDVRGTVKNWLSMALDPEEPEALRIATLHKGVTPVLAQLANALKHHKSDAQNGLTDHFATKAQDIAAKFIEVLPAPQATMDTLLSIAEGEGQASAPLRLAAFSTYMMARTQFCRMCDYVEGEAHAGRAMKLAAEFPQAQTMHARLMADIG